MEPEDWPAFQAHLRAVARDRSHDTPPGERVLDERVAIEGRADEVTQTIIDLSTLRGQGHRHLVLIIEPEIGLLASLRGQQPPVYRLWVQMSDLAVDAMTDSEEMVAWATSLAEGVALEGVDLTLYPGRATATTGADGLARLPLAASGPSDSGGYVIARRATTRRSSPRTLGLGRHVVAKRSTETTYRWYVWDDRGVYRPVRTSCQGWLRRVEFERGGDRLLLPARVRWPGT